jgi:hypothetical protein
VPKGVRSLLLATLQKGSKMDPHQAPLDVLELAQGPKHQPEALAGDLDALEVDLGRGRRHLAGLSDHLAGLVNQLTGIIDERRSS